MCKSRHADKARALYRFMVFLGAIALVGAVHGHAHHHSPPVAAQPRVDDSSWTVGWVWLIGWIFSIAVAYARKVPSAIFFVLFGWVIGPFSILVAAVIKPSPIPGVSSTPETDSNVALWLEAIQRGNLPPITPTGIMPLDGETFFYQQSAQYGQTYHQRVARGSNPALYVPLGHGFRMRVGGYQGTSQNVTNFMWGPMGTVYVSNLRIIFKANGTPDVAIATYPRILSYETYPNGLGLQVESIGTMQFRTGDVILGTLFQKIVERRFAASSVVAQSRTKTDSLPAVPGEDRV